MEEGGRRREWSSTASLRQINADLRPAQVEFVLAALPENLADVVADRTRLKQILMNYGSNAIKYGRMQGTVTLRTTANLSTVRVAVVDDGIGIPAAQQANLFRPFHRAGQETGPIEGTGIGLTITKRLAELMGSTVGFSSVEGQGSEFWVEIPVHERGDAAPLVSQARPVGSFLGGHEGPHYVIVYIEDIPSNIAFMEDLMSDLAQVELVTAPTADCY